MRQFNFTYIDICSALDGLHRIRSEIQNISPSHALLHVYVSGLSSAQTEVLLEAMDRVLANIPRIGISEFPTFKYPIKASIKINLIIATDSHFYPFQMSCTRGTEKETAEILIKKIEECRSVKGIEICSANQLMDSSLFIETVGEKYPEIPIFGSISKPARLTDNDVEILDDAFSIGYKINTDGYSIILYTGKHLELYLNYIQSWRPIGREMCFRLEENPVIGSSGIWQIEGVSALEIFLKYLGIPWDDNFLKNVWYFPLLITRNNINICFTPIGCREGTIYYGGRMNENEHIHFSYCTREELLDASFEESKRIQSLSAEALLLIICCNRYAFMQEEEKNEIDYYKNCIADFSYCHAYGEIAYKDKKGGMLNSALISIALREVIEIQKIDIPFFTVPKSRKFRDSTIPISFIISHFFDQMTHELVNYQKNLQFEVERIKRENENLTIHIVQTLADTIDAKDTYTNGHSSRVAKYAREISKIYGYCEKKFLEVYMIGLLHDVGKIGVPDFVINKKTKLTPDEYEVIKEHPVIGAHILANIQEMPTLMTGARWHHERYDGNGYPDGLKGEDIPEIARIIAVADAYDAMTSNRSYRNAMPQSVVRLEIEKGIGTQFDPTFAKIMLQMIDNDVDYTLHE